MQWAVDVAAQAGFVYGAAGALEFASQAVRLVIVEFNNGARQLANRKPPLHFIARRGLISGRPAIKQPAGDEQQVDAAAFQHAARLRPPVGRQASGWLARRPNSSSTARWSASSATFRISQRP